MMRKIIFGLIAVMGLGLFSCMDDEGYKIDGYWVGFGILQDEGGESVFAMDNKALLRAVNWSHNSEWNADFAPGSRVLMNYTIVGDETNDAGDITSYFVKVNDIRTILKKGILELTEANADSIGNDPIVVEDVWMTDSLLNMKVKYLGYDQIHFLNLVQNPLGLSGRSESLKLELRHNANNDEQNLPYSAFVSFSLNKLRVAEADSINLEILSTDYQGVSHIYRKTFDYSQLDLP